MRWSPALLWSTAPDGKVCYVDQRVVVVSLGWEDLIHPGDRGKVVPTWSHAVRTERRTLPVRAAGRDCLLGLNRLRREEREVLRARDGLRATRDGELAVDVFQVRLHGLRRDPQSPSDLLVRLTLGHEL